MRDYSAGARRKINSTSGEAPLVLLEITHPDLEAPIRVVQDNEDIVSTGDVFSAFSFDVGLPDDQDKQTPRASLAMDNVGRELTQWLDVSNGGEGAEARFMQVWRDDPDTIEWEATMGISNVDMDVMRVAAELGYEELLNKSGLPMRYDPRTSPGLF
jgi:hypothetical protein